MEISTVSQHGDQVKTGKNNSTAVVGTPVQCSNCIVVSASCHIFFISHFSLQLQVLVYFAFIPYSVPL